MAFLSPSNKQKGDQDIWKLLESERLLSKDQFRDFSRQAKREDRHVVDVLFESETIPADQLLEVLGQSYGLPTVKLRDRIISSYVLNLLPKQVAAQHNVVVFKKVKEVIHVATVSPDKDDVLAFIKNKTGFEPEVFLTTPADVQHALKRYTNELTDEFSRIISESTKEALESQDSEERLAQFLPIITMVDTLLDRALAARASDVHLEPRANDLYIRYRVDGLLQDIVTIPRTVSPAIIARLKLMSALKIDEHRLPQDGRFTYQFRDRQVHIRVSAVPTLHGTKMVLRLLDRRENEHSLSTLGLNSRDLPLVRKAMTNPQGLILVTGPTGSGKTTTLYTILGQLNKEHINIATIEDPVEYGLDGVNQTQINPAAGLTFANGLRSLLRQDPNVIMVGEIRDSDTADIAINAAMTGHLVLTTLHTTSAFMALQRLAEMGVPPYLSAPVTRLLIGQRLVRKICKHCTTRQGSTPKVLEKFATYFDLPGALAKFKRLKLIPEEATLDGTSFFSGRGCDKCQQTGYLGRIGVYEIVPIDQTMAHALVNDSSSKALSQLAAQAGVLTLTEDGILKTFYGTTTFDEVLRVTRE